MNYYSNKNFHFPENERFILVLIAIQKNAAYGAFQAGRD